LVLKEHDSIESIPEALREHYAKGADGKFRPTFEGSSGWALEDVGGLRKALGAERGTREQLERTVKAFDGIDPSVARDALDKVGKIKDWTPGEKVEAQIAAVKEAMSKAHGAEKSALEAKASKLDKELRRVLVVSAAAQSMAKHKADVALLMPHVERSVQVAEVGDRFEVRVVGDDGNPLIASDGSNMSLDAFVGGVLREKFPAAYPSSGAQGGGAQGSRHSGGAPGAFTISREEAKDVNKYARVREAAEKAGQQVQFTG
jgi:hypothetical protein